MNKKTIYAISKSEAQINRILSSVFREGSSTCDISVIPPHQCPQTQTPPWSAKKIPEGAMQGIVVGGTIGIGLALLVNSGSEDVASILPIMTAGSGAGTIISWFAGSRLSEIILPMFRKSSGEKNATTPANSIPEGNFLISIRTNNRQVVKVQRVLEEEGAKEINFA